MKERKRRPFFMKHRVHIAKNVTLGLANALFLSSNSSLFI